MVYPLLVHSNSVIRNHSYQAMDVALKIPHERRSSITDRLASDLKVCNSIMITAMLFNLSDPKAKTDIVFYLKIHSFFCQTLLISEMKRLKSDEAVFKSWICYVNLLGKAIIHNSFSISHIVCLLF